MFKTVVKSALRFTRHTSVRTTCSGWRPVQPLDPSTKVDILHNGVRVATECIESPLACVSMFVAVGSRYETVCNNGLTHFIEHLAFKGFKTLNRDRLEAEVIAMESKMSVKTTREMQVFTVILPSEKALLAVEKLSKIISELDFNEMEMERERYNISLELCDTDNNPRKVVFDYLHATAFQGTPLAQRVIGPSHNIARFDAATACSFLSEHYQPYRIILATSGDVPHSKIMCIAESRFGTIAPQPGCEPEVGPNRFTGSQVLYRDDSMPFAHVTIAFEAPGYTDLVSYLTLLVMKNIVGSWDRSQGLGTGNAPIVARACAMDNLCESYQAFYITYRDIGLWGVYFVADKWKLDEVVFHIQQQWMNLCLMVQQAEMERGINLTRLELARRFDSVVSSSHDLGTQIMYTSGRKSLQNLSNRLLSIKVDSVRELAYKMMYDRCPAVAAMGPTETLPDYLRIKSGFWWLRL